MHRASWFHWRELAMLQHTSCSWQFCDSNFVATGSEEPHMEGKFRYPHTFGYVVYMSQFGKKRWPLMVLHHLPTPGFPVLSWDPVTVLPLSSQIVLTYECVFARCPIMDLLPIHGVFPTSRQAPDPPGASNIYYMASGSWLSEPCYRWRYINDVYAFTL